MLISPFAIFYRKNFNYLFFIVSLSFQARMSWNIGENRNLFIKQKSYLGHCYVVLTTAKTAAEKPKLTAIEMQQLSIIKKTYSKKNVLAGNGQYSSIVNFKSDTEKLNVLVHRYRNRL